MKQSALIAAAAAAMAGSSFAGPTYTGTGTSYNSPTFADISYSYFEGYYQHIETDHFGSQQTDGAGLNLSYSPFQYFYIVGGGGWSSGDADIFSASAGVGGYFPLIPGHLHIAADAGVAWVDIDIEGAESEDALYVNPHLRFQPVENFTIHAGAVYSGFDHSDEWTGYAKVYIQIFEGVDLLGGVTVGDDTTAVQAGVRIRF